MYFGAVAYLRHTRPPRVPYPPLKSLHLKMGCVHGRKRPRGKGQKGREAVGTGDCPGDGGGAQHPSWGPSLCPSPALCTLSHLTNFHGHLQIVLHAPINPAGSVGPAQLSPGLCLQNDTTGDPGTGQPHPQPPINTGCRLDIGVCPQGT